MGTSTIKLKKHESFSIREGWLEKGINIIKSNQNCFLKDQGSTNFGIGTNMVKSLKYWLDVCDLASFKQGAFLTPFGELLLIYDRYLEDIFSWWLIHVNLSTNNDLARVINEYFNMDYTKIEKEAFIKYLIDKLSQNYIISSESSLESDVSVLFKTYHASDSSNPEQNLNCPLSKLGLINIVNKKYVKTNPKLSSLNYLVVYYCFMKLISSQSTSNTNDTYNLEDLVKLDNNPLKILNISMSALMIYFDEMKNHGLINITKTAGLNTVKFEEKLELMEIFKEYYKG